MRKIVMFLLGLSLFGLSSCIDMLEQLYLNKDGSGVYTFTMDMSSMFTDPMMKGMMEEMMKGEDGLNLKNGMSEEIDSTINFGDMPADMKQKMEKPDFWKKVNMHMVMSEQKNKMFIELKLDFDSMDDITYFYENMDQMGEDQGNGMMGGGLSGMMPGGALFELGKKSLKRLPTPKPDELMDGEEMDMAKMFLSTAEYKTIYHFPGRVKKTTIPGAQIDGNTVTVVTSLVEVMEGKADVAGEIKFKKK